MNSFKKKLFVSISLLSAIGFTTALDQLPEQDFEAFRDRGLHDFFDEFGQRKLAEINESGEIGAEFPLTVDKNNDQLLPSKIEEFDRLKEMYDKIKEEKQQLEQEKIRGKKLQEELLEKQVELDIAHRARERDLLSQAREKIEEFDILKEMYDKIKEEKEKEELGRIKVLEQEKRNSQEKIKDLELKIKRLGEESNRIIAQEEEIRKLRLEKNQLEANYQFVLKRLERKEQSLHMHERAIGANSLKSLLPQPSPDIVNVAATLISPNIILTDRDGKTIEVIPTKGD